MGPDEALSAAAGEGYSVAKLTEKAEIPVVTIALKGLTVQALSGGCFCEELALSFLLLPCSP